MSGENELLGETENFICENEFSDFHSIYECPCLHFDGLNPGRRDSTGEKHYHK